MENKDNSLLITQIVRGSYVDGEGLRSVFFLKGCPLRCSWCHNPETQNIKPEILYDSRRCIKCRQCFDTCELNAINSDADYIIDITKCNACAKCVDGCPTNALKLSGLQMSFDKVMEEILKDKVFYENSNGGVTFSGGEPLLQYKALMPILKECKKKHISTCIDTCFAVDEKNIEYVKDHVDLFLVDIKHTSEKEFAPEIVFKNIEKFAKTNKIWIRIPVIPGFNDSISEMKKVADFVNSVKGNIEKVCVLPFHNTAGMKYGYLNRTWNYDNTELIDEEKIKEFEDIFK